MMRRVQNPLEKILFRPLYVRRFRFNNNELEKILKIVSRKIKRKKRKGCFFFVFFPSFFKEKDEFCIPELMDDMQMIGISPSSSPSELASVIMSRGLFKFLISRLCRERESKSPGRHTNTTDKETSRNIYMGKGHSSYCVPAKRAERQPSSQGLFITIMCVWVCF